MRDDDTTLVNSILFLGVLISLAVLFYFIKLNHDKTIEGLESKKLRKEIIVKIAPRYKLKKLSHCLTM